MSETQTQNAGKEELVPVKKEDFLDQDPALRNQNFFCISFISPEDVIRKKETYFFNKFLSSFSSDVDEFLNNTREKYKDDPVINDMIRTLRERYEYIFDVKALEHEYEHFKRENTEQLESSYHEINNFQTTIRGFKIRGCYDSYKEATGRAEQIKKFDPAFHVFVGQVGCWCPWSPYPEDIQDQEYSETQLNTLMKKYKEGQEIKNELYRMRKNELVQKVTMHPVSEVDEVVDAAEESENSKLMSEEDAWTQKNREEKK